jgi:aldehyde:ferredoxin oxidoreductase
MATAAFGGWTGKTLRVNLSIRRISTEDTVARYKDYLGGTGFGYKVLWDEVPAKTGCYDEANKIIIATGPLTGTSAPTSGRTSITCIYPAAYPVELVASGHMGGHWGAELKYAGWDAIIIEGKSEKPVYLSIVDAKVEIKDASHLWGSGTYRTAASLCQEMGPETQVAAIGQAGENLVRMASVQCSYEHSAGGIGGVFGSKKLKAIAVKGTGAVRIAAGKAEWKKLHLHVISLMGSNNQAVVPATPQPWAEFSASTRWNARKGLFWGAAQPPVETGECDPADLNTIGLRCHKAILDMGPLAEQFTVRSGGCSSCPIRCHWRVELPQIEQYGVSRFAGTTCERGQSVRMFPNAPRNSVRRLEISTVGVHLLDDYGIWTHYSQLERDFVFGYGSGAFKAALPADEYKAIPWNLYEANDPAFLLDIYRRIAYKDGLLGTALGEGSGRTADMLKYPKEYYTDASVTYWGHGKPQHHSNGDNGQVGVLLNMIYNRDAACHSNSNFTLSGLPVKVLMAVAEKNWGPGAVDPRNNYTPMNPAKASWAVWGLLRKEMHDSLTLCNYTWPMSNSPLKSRNYEGDLSVEAQMYSLATGDKKNEKELDLVCERIFTLHRALTIRDWGNVQMREQRDVIPPWIFDSPPDAKPFTPGVSKMDRADMELAKDLFYDALGWDRKTGAPTRATYERLGMKDVADGLEKMKLLPA